MFRDKADLFKGLELGSDNPQSSCEEVGVRDVRDKDFRALLFWNCDNHVALLKLMVKTRLSREGKWMPDRGRVMVRLKGLPVGNASIHRRRGCNARW